jgi:putative ABC transport system substrate-binding protein
MTSCIRRREFIATLGGAAAAWPLAAGAQQAAMPVIGFVDGESASQSAHLAASFRQGLSDTGYVDGRNVLIEYRWAEGHYDRLPSMAAELVRRQVTVIAASAIPAARAAKAATTTVPIVFRIGANPVEAGLVASLNRPGGNLTGVTSLGGELGPKRLELLHELVPMAKVSTLVKAANPYTGTLLRDLQAAARTLGVELDVLHAGTEHEIEVAFASLAQLRVGALVIAPDGFLTSRSEQVAALALLYAVPAIYQYRAFAAAGGLMSYGDNIRDSYRLAGAYTGRILKGDKPADLPVQQATKVELIINLKTAKALGVTVPLTLRGRADEVIE